MIGQRLGSYEIVEEVGRGGMATVYRAYQASVDRFVALKVIEHHNTDDPQAVENFQREARLIARLEHVHILPVYDFDGNHKPPYIVMRYLNGGTLRDILRRGSLSLEQTGYIFQQVAAALDYSHRQGIIHRDIKPSNIMIDHEGNAFVSDFGIARVIWGSDADTATRNTLGTPDYMSPERIMGYDTVDNRTDIYSLGVMLFLLVTRRLPFSGSTPMETMMRHMNQPVPTVMSINPALPPQLDTVIQQAIAKDPAERFPTVASMAAALSEALHLSGGSGTSPIKALAEETKTLMLQPGQPLRRKHGNSKSILPDTDTATAGQTTSNEQNKVVTALYVDAAEYAILIEESKDAEAARTAISRFFEVASQQVTEFGGQVFSKTENHLLAVWGTIVSQENDAENAIRAALAIRTLMEGASARLLKADETLPIKIGLNTGMVLLTRIAMTGEYTASGVTLNLANRLAEQSEGVVLITHDTFRLVRGAFDIVSDVPLKVRGRKEPVMTYTVMTEKARAFRLESRGVLGVETTMIGREGELKQLQNAFDDMVEEGESQIIVLISEAGLGKSRLLYEFSSWAELRTEIYWLLRGRASVETAERPYSLLRNMLSFRFEILESDSLGTVRQKIETGVTQLTGGENREMAHLIGHLIGFDFSDSPFVKGLLSDPGQLVQRGRRMLKHFMKATAQDSPVLIQLEDVHVADEQSLLWFSECLEEYPDLPLMVVMLARPELLPRLSSWKTIERSPKQIVLKPLSRRESRSLVAEILKKAPDVPHKLRDVIVDQAEGNPFFIEETIKMLIEDRVIEVSGERWRVEESRLERLRVPPSLMGLLQARLDTLLYPERLTLQRASVIGRIFYDTALTALDRADDVHLDDLAGVLKKLVEREFVQVRQSSAFAGAVEYIFAQNMLRDVVNGSLLKRQLKTYHTAAADWLAATAGDRIAEYLPLIAQHYEVGNDPARAADYYRRAGERALSQCAYDHARSAFEKSITLLPITNKADRMRVQIRLGETLAHSGLFDAADAVLNEALSTAHALNDIDAQANALNQLSMHAVDMGRFVEAKGYLDEALPLARSSADRRTLGWVLYGLANVYMRLGNYEQGTAIGEEGLTLARQLGDPVLEVFLLNRLGTLCDDPLQADVYYEAGLALARKIGHRQREASLLGNLGVSASERNDENAAVKYTEAVLAISREIGDWMVTGLALGNLAASYIVLKQFDRAIPLIVEKIALARRLDAQNSLVAVVGNIADLKREQGKITEYLKYAGAQKAHPSTSSELIAQINGFVQEIREKYHLTEAEIEAALESGRGLDIDGVVDAFLREVQTVEGKPSRA